MNWCAQHGYQDIGGKYSLSDHETGYLFRTLHINNNVNNIVINIDLRSTFSTISQKTY